MGSTGTEVRTAPPRPPGRPVAPATPGARRAVWAVTLLHLGLLLAYSVMVPALRGPDEYLHVDRARQLAPGVAESPGGSVSPAVLAARESAPVYQAQSPPVPTDDAVPSEERPSFADLGAEAPRDVTNTVTQQPPLVHAIGAGVLAAASVLPGWPWPFDRVVALLRLVEVAVVAGVPFLAWATARRLGSPPRSALTAAVLVVAVPQLTHIGSTFNSEGLLVALAGVLFLLGARVITGDDSVRTAVLAGLATGAALLTSGLAVVFVPWVAGAYLLAPGAAEGRAPTRPRLALAGLVALVVGGWWWVRELVVEGQLAFGLDASQVRPVADGEPLSLTHALATLVSSFWGGFGWLEASLPVAAVVLATVVLVGALAVAFWRGRVSAVRLRLALFVFPAVALAVMVAVGAVVTSLGGSGAFTFQGRYLLPGLVGLVVVAAVGLDQLRRRPVPALPLLAVFAALAMQALAVAAIVGRYWSGGGAGAGERLRAVLAFSPWPPVLVFFTGIGILGLVVWTLVEVGRVVRASLLAPPPPRPRPVTP